MQSLQTNWIYLVFFTENSFYLLQTVNLATAALVGYPCFSFFEVIFFVIIGPAYLAISQIITFNILYW